MAIKPLEDRVVVKLEQAEQTTASGLVIPETAKEKPQEARVVAVGPGRVDDKGNRVPVDIAEGDVVVFSRYGGTEVKYQGEEYLILSARDGLAMVEYFRIYSGCAAVSSGGESAIPDLDLAHVRLLRYRTLTTLKE